MKKSFVVVVSALCAAASLQATAATQSQSITSGKTSAPLVAGQSELVRTGHLGVCDTAIGCAPTTLSPTEVVTVGHLGVCDTAIGCGAASVNSPAEQSEPVKIGHLGVCDTAIGCGAAQLNP